MKKITQYALTLFCTLLPLHAQELDSTYDTKSLVAVEGNYNFNDKSNAYTHFGVKVGAESKEYRIFLAAREYESEEVGEFYAYGVELQYLFNFSRYANLYVGINGGITNLQESDDDSYLKYYGGDVGVNFHISSLVDIEAGARNSEIDGLKSLQIGYVSCIIKYNMD
jgi:hypothetical protein